MHLTLLAPVTKIAKFANSVDPNEVAHNEPPHLDLLCLPSSFLILKTIYSRTSMARTPLGPLKLVRDKGDSS